LYTNYLVMVIENCKKIEPVVVKLRSKTKYTTFFWTRCMLILLQFSFASVVDLILTELILVLVTLKVWYEIL